jgi:hypothetical protein
MGLVVSSPVLVAGCSGQQKSTLALILDTLLPADEYPGALELGYEHRLSQQINTDSAKFGYLSGFAEQIDVASKRHHKKAFSALSVEQREALLEQILETGAQMTQRNLIRLRSLIFRWYYGSAQGQRSLGYLAPATYPARAKL